MESQIISIVLTGIVAATGAYVAAVVKFRQDLRADYDKALREDRITEYRSLWKLTEQFPKYARTEAVHQKDVPVFAAALRDWYFEHGGIFLSDLSRNAYFDLQETLGEVTQAAANTPNQVIEEPVYEAIRHKCSALRTAMTQDVGTRRKPEVAA